ncbi:acyltransferase family protein [Actinoplanes philippinensis]|uniref:acyltransferase family protein n=1 Tax=Actinoplanes philippinensis TaxID=35752 RepID=UPI0033FCE1BA
MNRDRANTSPRLAALDGLRLIAALAVAVFHLSVSWRLDGQSPPAYYLPDLAPIAAYGFLGVELFFLISGFVIGMSSWRRSLGEFFVSRVSRLYPAYWVCILITVAVVAILPVTGGVPISGVPEARDIAVNMTMLQEPLGIPAVDTVYWTLFVELRFYLLFAALVAFGLTYRRTVIFCVTWMIVAVIGPTLDSRIVNILAIPEYAPYFIAGIAMFLINRFGRSPLLFAIIGFSWLVSINRVEQRVGTINPGFEVPTWPGIAIVTLCYLVVLAVALGWTDRIRWSWLTTAGALTYPFYLLHQRIGYGLIRHAQERTSLPVWALLLGAITVVLGLAWLVHRFVERPLSRWLRTMLRRAIADVRRVSAAEAAAAGPAGQAGLAGSTGLAGAEGSARAGAEGSARAGAPAATRAGHSEGLPERPAGVSPTPRQPSQSTLQNASH